MRSFLWSGAAIVLVACSNNSRPCCQPQRVVRYGPPQSAPCAPPTMAQAPVQRAPSVAPCAPPGTVARAPMAPHVPQAPVAQAPVARAPVAPAPVAPAPVAPARAPAPSAFPAPGAGDPAAMPPAGPASRPLAGPSDGPSLGTPSMGSPVMPRTPTAGPFWHTRLADAQAQARQEGKLILVGSTKPSCGLCDKFKEDVLPQAQVEARQITVGYLVDAMNPEAPQIWQMLKDNLPQARLMPLIGIVTPDLRWVTGFSGPTDVNMLHSALATARRNLPAAAPAPQVPLLPPDRRTSDRGSVPAEWTPLSDLRREATHPEDALTPELAAAGPVLPPAPAAPPSERRAPAADSPILASPRPGPLTHVGPVAGLPDAVPAVATLPVRARTPLPGTPDAEVATWAEESLRIALSQIQQGDWSEARQTLGEVSARLPQSLQDREAARGGAALYHAVQIAEADIASRDWLAEQARRNFHSSMWAPLFE
jgi:hypothetical protein